MKFCLTIFWGLFSTEVFKSVGCWRDEGLDRVLTSLEGSHKLLKARNYKNRNNALVKCAKAAMDKGLNIFGLENGGQCYGGIGSTSKYNKHGTSNYCQGT